MNQFTLLWNTLQFAHLLHSHVFIWNTALILFERKKEALSYSFKRFEIVLFFFCRLVLKCRSKARKQFAALRSDVLVKLELLDNKHFQDMVFQLKRLLDGLAKFHILSQDIVSQEKLFPIECDFAPSLEEATNGPEETGFDWFMMWAKLSIPSTLNTDGIFIVFLSFSTSLGKNTF